MQTSDLATANIWHFQVCVQQQIKWKCNIFAGIKHTNVEMELFFTQN